MTIAHDHIFYGIIPARLKGPTMKKSKPGRGRPQKYGRPSKAVTVSLPHDVLARLKARDADLGRAIVALVDRDRTRPRAVGPAEVTAYGRLAVIIVSPARVLKRLPGVQLVPVGNGRALISLDQPNSVPRLELDMRDALEASDINQAERQALEAIAEILRHARHTPGVSLRERSIIVLEAKRQHRERR
jgi:hypothetical protein